MPSRVVRESPSCPRPDVPAESTRGDRAGNESSDARTCDLVFLDLAQCRAEDREVLTQAELAEAEGMLGRDQRRRWIAGRAATRRALAARLGLPARAIEIRRTLQNRPELRERTGRLAALDFNLSHSGDVGLLGIAEGRRIGVDVERVRRVPGLLDMARRYFQPAEAEAIAAAPAALRADLFFGLWTRKEALLKALGTGLSGGLHRPEIRVHRGGRLELACVDQDRAKAAACTVLDLDQPGYKACAVLLTG